MTPDKISDGARKWMDDQLAKAVIRQQIEIHMRRMRLELDFFWNYQKARLTKIDGKRRGMCMVMADIETCRAISKMVEKSR